MMKAREIILVVLVVSALVIAPKVSVQADVSRPDNAVGNIVIVDAGDNADVEFKAVEACEGIGASGFFKLNGKGGAVKIDAVVRFVKVDGRYTWFAGQCTPNSPAMAGRWFFAVAHDGGEPGKLVDHLWLDWLTRSPDAAKIAERKVENYEKPSCNKPIKDGNIIICSSS